MAKFVLNLCSWHVLYSFMPGHCLVHLALLLYIRCFMFSNLVLFYVFLFLSIFVYVWLLFAYFILIPAALNFFIGYSTDVIEPIWSFDQYFDFILFVFYSTGLSFQIPIIQIILGLAGIITGKQMLGLWRYVVLAATIISAILTPSTDPITQICLATAILFLYLVGAGILIFYKK